MKHADSIPDSTLCRLHARLSLLESALNRRVHGQPEMIRQALATIIAGGHMLIQGPPGLGKSYFMRLLAASLQAEARFFWNDGSFLGCNLAVIDEIDHCPTPFLRSLLSALQEGETLADNEPCYLARPFVAVGILNDSSRGHPLPLSLLDRFYLRITLGPPAEKDEIRIINSASLEDDLSIPKYFSPDDILRIQRIAESIRVSKGATKLTAQILRAARSPEDAGLHDISGLISPSSRAGIHLIQICRALCLLEGRNLVRSSDIRRNVPAVLGHRIGAPGVDPDMLDSFLKYLT